MTPKWHLLLQILKNKQKLKQKVSLLVQMQEIHNLLLAVCDLNLLQQMIDQKTIEELKRLQIEVHLHQHRIVFQQNRLLRDKLLDLLC